MPEVKLLTLIIRAAGLLQISLIMSQRPKTIPLNVSSVFDV